MQKYCKDEKKNGKKFKKQFNQLKINTQPYDLFTTYRKGTPGDYLEYDDYFQNENTNPLEKYYYITNSWAANSNFHEIYF